MTTTATTATAGYTPDADLKVHDHAIKLLCQPFQTHENGLPEWPKNAADEYARRNVPEDERIIVITLQNAKGTVPASIGCLDFSGMTSAIIDEKFRHWGDPEAAAGGEDVEVQGGHGNGGKCYMAQLFQAEAYVDTVSAGLECRYGTVGGEVRFGYFPDADAGRDVAVDDHTDALRATLAEVGIDLDALPPSALAALGSGDGYTYVVGQQPKGYPKKIDAKRILEDLQDHPQMRRTLELCKVYVVANGTILNDGKPLALAEIPPMEGAEKPRVITIPDELADPKTGEMLSTRDGGDPSGELVLRTSAVSMHHGRKASYRRARHIISFRAKSGYIGFKPVHEFDVTSSYRDRVYGDCILLALEECKQNMRAELAESPLSRAVEAWIGRQIEEWAKFFELRDRQRHDQEERSAVSTLNEALNDWKNNLLEPLLGGGGDTGDGPPPPPERLPSGTCARIELSLSVARAGIGVPLKPLLKFFDPDGKRIRPHAVSWASSEPNVALVDEALALLNTFKAGAAVIEAETLDGKIKSNKVTLEVVLIDEITLAPTEVQVPIGSRRHIEATCKLRTGEILTGVMLIWQEGDSAVANVSAAGNVYGFKLGETEVTAMDEHAEATNTSKVRVVEGDGSGDEGGKGKSYPRVLISEFDPDPDTGEEVILSPDDPPVHQRPQDVPRNIWWINAAAPAARVYGSADKGFGYDSREWRIYHMERFIDVIVQILLVTGPASEDELDSSAWIGRWGERASDVQASAAKTLATFVESGNIVKH
jgi:hypothetical protein